MSVVLELHTACKTLTETLISLDTLNRDSHSGRDGDEDSLWGRRIESKLNLHFFIRTISDQLARANVSIQNGQGFNLAPAVAVELPIACAYLTDLCARRASRHRKEPCRPRGADALQQVTVHNVDVLLNDSFIRFIYCQRLVWRCQMDSLQIADIDGCQWLWNEICRLIKWLLGRDVDTFICLSSFAHWWSVAIYSAAISLTCVLFRHTLFLLQNCQMT